MIACQSSSSILMLIRQYHALINICCRGFVTEELRKGIVCLLFNEKSIFFLIIFIDINSTITRHFINIVNAVARKSFRY